MARKKAAKKTKKHTPRNVEFKYDGHILHLNAMHISRKEAIKLVKWFERVLKWKNSK